MLADRDIQQLVENYDLILPYNRENLQPNSYDVTLGNDFIIYKPTATFPFIDAKTRELTNMTTCTVHTSKFILPANGFVLATTCETVSLPDNIAATVEGKSSLGRLGLAVHVTAGFIDAGFIGKITLELKNETPYTIVLHEGMGIAQLAFHQLSCYAENPYRVKGHYQNQQTVQGAK